MVEQAETTVEDVRARNDIVDVISEFVRLRKAGRSFKGLCPFHKEKTPSFMVNPERQMFHCFGCGVGGDVFSFIMTHEKLEFPEALRYLAERAGLPPPRSRRTQRASQNEPVYRANLFAATFYHERLGSAVGRAALAYLEKRGLNAETIGFFQVGYAPPGRDELLRAARRENLSLDDLTRAGLVGTDGRGNPYDRFRGRIMFPIYDVGGRVVGLGGRVLGDGEPKYLNSPETPVFRKGAQLYGLNWARREIAREERALLVEGYLDLVALRQYGIESAVATMGTALASDAARILARYAGRVTIVNDGDTAGRKAALRSAEVLLASGVRVDVAMMPAGADPDSFVRSEGAEAFRRVVRDALGIVEFLFGGARSYEARERATRLALGMFAGIHDPVRRGWYVKELAERSGLDEGMLQRAAASKKDLPPETVGRAARRESTDGAVRAEQGLVQYLLDAETLDPEVVDGIRSFGFKDPASRQLVVMLLEALEGGGRLSSTELVSEVADPAARALIAELSFREDIVDGPRQARDCLARLRRRDLKDRIAATKGEMRGAEGRGDGDALRRLQATYLELVAQLKTQGPWTAFEGDSERSTGG